MAVTHKKSTTITALENAQQSMLNKTMHGGVVKEKVETYEVTADDAGSTTRFFRVHSGWRVGSIKVYADDAGAAGEGDWGLYDTTENGGAVVDANFWADAFSLSTAALTGSEANLAQAFGAEKIGKELWEQLGLSADPNKWYDVALTVGTALSGVATVTVVMRYVDGN